MSDSNQYELLANEDAKQSPAARSSLKDDVKQQAFAAREGVKQKATQLREAVSSTLDKAKDAAANLTGHEGIRSERGAAKIKEQVEDAAQGEWETVQRKGHRAAKKAEAALDENLTPDQKQRLQKGLKDAKQGAVKFERKFDGYFTRIFNTPALRPAGRFVHKYHLSLPITIAAFLLFMYITTSFFSFLAMRALTPKVPEFDIHSRENSLAWAKYHAGEYKDKVLDAKDSLSARAAAFLANHEWEKLKGKAVDWKEIGEKKLGLAEPTLSERVISWWTGEPLTWQGRVENVLTLAKQGIANVDLKTMKQQAKDGLRDAKDSLKDSLGMGEPTLFEKARNILLGEPETRTEQAIHKASNLGDRIVDGLKDKVDNIRSHLPGSSAEAIEAAKQKAYDATHQSTVDKIKSGAEYVKNRIVHGSQEAAHIAQDRLNEAADKAKYHTGL